LESGERPEYKDLSVRTRDGSKATNNWEREDFPGKRDYGRPLRKSRLESVIGKRYA